MLRNKSFKIDNVNYLKLFNDFFFQLKQLQNTHDYSILENN